MRPPQWIERISIHHRNLCSGQWIKNAMPIFSYSKSIHLRGREQYLSGTSFHLPKNFVAYFLQTICHFLIYNPPKYISQNPLANRKSIAVTRIKPVCVFPVTDWSESQISKSGETEDTKSQKSPIKGAFYRVFRAFSIDIRGGIDHLHMKMMTKL